MAKRDPYSDPDLNPAQETVTFGTKQTMDSFPSWMKEDLSPTNPLPWQQYFDESIVGNKEGKGGLINDQIDRAYSSIYADGSQNPDGYFQKMLNRGFDDSAPELSVSSMDRGNPMSMALAKKYSGMAGDKIKSISDQNKFRMSGTLSKELGRIGNELGIVERHNMQNFKEQYEYQQKRQAIYNAWKAAKDQGEAQFWSSVIGLGMQAGVMAI